MDGWRKLTFFFFLCIAVKKREKEFISLVDMWQPTTDDDGERRKELFQSFYLFQRTVFPVHHVYIHPSA